MDEYLKGSCQRCGNSMEFPAAFSGTTIDCPHCGQETRLKPGPSEAIVLASLAEELPMQEREEDSPMRKRFIRLALISGFLFVVVAILIVTAELLLRYAAMKHHPM